IRDKLVTGVQTCALPISSLDHWDGNGALGYLTLAAICDDLEREEPWPARVVTAAHCFPTGVLGYWVRRLADAGFVALLTATSPRSEERRVGKGGRAGGAA